MIVPFLAISQQETGDASESNKPSVEVVVRDETDAQVTSSAEADPVASETPAVKLEAEPEAEAEAPVIDDDDDDDDVGDQSHPQQPQPEQWERVLDPTTNSYYYWNKETNETRWSRPDGLFVVESSQAEASGSSSHVAGCH